MILALDVGNGSVKYARFDGETRFESGRLPVDADFAALPAAGDVAAVSVHPEALDRVRTRYPGLRVVGRDVALPLPAYEGCGPDRVMAVVGALHRRPDAQAVLVLDSGTCLTATLGVRGEGVAGGAILPGIDLMAGALASGTRTLPRVEAGAPESAVARSTPEAIRSGTWAAFVGGARELVERFREESAAAFDVVAAGSGGGALAAALEEVDALHPFATLWGVFLSCRS